MLHCRDTVLKQQQQQQQQQQFVNVHTHLPHKNNPDVSVLNTTLVGSFQDSLLKLVGEVDNVATLWTLWYQDAALNTFWAVLFYALFKKWHRDGLPNHSCDRRGFPGWSSRSIVQTAMCLNSFSNNHGKIQSYRSLFLPFFFLLELIVKYVPMWNFWHEFTEYKMQLTCPTCWNFNMTKFGTFSHGDSSRTWYALWDWCCVSHHFYPPPDT